MRSLIIRTFVMLLVAVPVLGSTAQAATGSAEESIRRFNETLLSVMQEAQSLGYKGRYEKLEPVVKDLFDTRFMTNYTVKNHWKSLTDEQKAGLVDAFERVTIATYANRFNGYSNEEFKVLDTVPQKQEMQLVKTALVKTDGENIAINYLLRETAEGWQVVDIFLKGFVSELATRRSEYSAVMKREGYDGLLDRMEQQVAKLSQ